MAAYCLPLVSIFETENVILKQWPVDFQAIDNL